MICIEKPPEFDASHQQTNEWTAWYSLLDDWKKRPRPTTSISSPVENMWLFPLRSGLSQANFLLGLCSRYHVAYRSFLLEGAPEECE